jgi:hypothetical protein
MLNEWNLGFRTGQVCFERLEFGIHILPYPHFSSSSSVERFTIPPFPSFPLSLLSFFVRTAVNKSPKTLNRNLCLSEAHRSRRMNEVRVKSK